MQEDYDNKLNSLQVQKSSILTATSQVKKDMEDKQNEYDASIKQIEQEHFARLEEMANKQEQDLANINVEYDKLVNNEELIAIRNNYQDKQKEYADVCAF